MAAQKRRVLFGVAREEEAFRNWINAQDLVISAETRGHNRRASNARFGEAGADIPIFLHNLFQDCKNGCALLVLAHEAA